MRVREEPQRIEESNAISVILNGNLKAVMAKSTNNKFSVMICALGLSQIYSTNSYSGIIAWPRAIHSVFGEIHHFYCRITFFVLFVWCVNFPEIDNKAKLNYFGKNE